MIKVYIKITSITAQQIISKIPEDKFESVYFILSKLKMTKSKHPCLKYWWNHLKNNEFLSLEQILEINGDFENDPKWDINEHIVIEENKMRENPEFINNKLDSIS